MGNFSKSKQFVFLGIYSGEYQFKEQINTGVLKGVIERSYGLGNVWYSFLVPEIINEGLVCSDI